MVRLNALFVFMMITATVIISLNGHAFGLELEGDYTFAYVASEDRRIYVVDLLRNEVIFKSDEIEGIGKPTAIDVDQKRKRLYISSRRGQGQMTYSPIVVVDVRTSPIKAVDWFELNTDKEVSAPDSKGEVSAVYTLIVSPDRNNLYVGYSHPDYVGGTTVVDSETGKIKGSLHILIDKRFVFSPDGKQAAAIYPSGSEVIRLPDGTEKTRKWSGGLTVFDIEKNKEVLKKEGVKLHPPWGKIEWPLMYIESGKVLKKIDRDTEKVLGSIDLEKSSGGLKTLAQYPQTFDRGRKVVLIMTDEEKVGYIVVVDVKNMRLLSKVKIGKVGVDPTDIALSNEIPQISK